ncbi:hypothetical protein BGW38_007837 [Lunasporangiospora selenospora]|uniref:Xylanolytic transcriptional activator regulatory domain-containing protein n=1 Tax=Lunasporangiospora selenospora TaxID=979761 RepID=A0A9P6KGG3_9FUNG|nr:hypothetical protein BGW38_007837 [Lunasporangiospora selenospora]
MRTLIGKYLMYLHPHHQLVDEYQPDFWTRLDRPMSADVAAVVYAMCVAGALFTSPFPGTGSLQKEAYDIFQYAWSFVREKELRPKSGLVTIQTILILQPYLILTQQIEEAIAAHTLVFELAEHIRLGEWVQKLHVSAQGLLSPTDRLVRNTWRLAIWVDILANMAQSCGSKNEHDVSPVTTILDDFSNLYNIVPHHLRWSSANSQPIPSLKGDIISSGVDHQTSKLPGSGLAIASTTLDIIFRMGHIFLLNRLPLSVRMSPTGLGPRRESPLRILGTSANGITATVDDLIRKLELQNYVMVLGQRCLTEAALIQYANRAEQDPSISTPAKLNILRTKWCIDKTNLSLPPDVLDRLLEPYVNASLRSPNAEQINRLPSPISAMCSSTVIEVSSSISPNIYSIGQATAVRPQRDISQVSDNSSLTTSTRESSQPMDDVVLVSCRNVDKGKNRAGLVGRYPQMPSLVQTHEGTTASLQTLSLESPSPPLAPLPTVTSASACQGPDLDPYQFQHSQIYPVSRAEDVDGHRSRSSSMSMLSPTMEISPTLTIPRLPQESSPRDARLLGHTTSSTERDEEGGERYEPVIERHEELHWASYEQQGAESDSHGLYSSVGRIPQSEAESESEPDDDEGTEHDWSHALDSQDIILPMKRRLQSNESTHSIPQQQQWTQGTESQYQEFDETARSTLLNENTESGPNSEQRQHQRRRTISEEYSAEQPQVHHQIRSLPHTSISSIEIDELAFTCPDDDGQLSAVLHCADDNLQSQAGGADETLQQHRRHAPDENQGSSLYNPVVIDIESQTTPSEQIFNQHDPTADMGTSSIPSRVATTLVSLAANIPLSTTSAMVTINNNHHSSSVSFRSTPTLSTIRSPESSTNEAQPAINGQAGFVQHLRRPSQEQGPPTVGRSYVPYHHHLQARGEAKITSERQPINDPQPPPVNAEFSDKVYTPRGQEQGQGEERHPNPAEATQKANAGSTAGRSYVPYHHMVRQVHHHILLQRQKKRRKHPSRPSKEELAAERREFIKIFGDSLQGQASSSTSTDESGHEKRGGVETIIIEEGDEDDGGLHHSALRDGPVSGSVGTVNGGSKGVRNIPSPISVAVSTTTTAPTSASTPTTASAPSSISASVSPTAYGGFMSLSPRSPLSPNTGRLGGNVLFGSTGGLSGANVPSRRSSSTSTWHDHSPLIGHDASSSNTSENSPAGPTKSMTALRVDGSSTPASRTSAASPSSPSPLTATNIVAGRKRLSISMYVPSTNKATGDADESEYGIWTGATKSPRTDEVIASGGVNTLHGRHGASVYYDDQDQASMDRTGGEWAGQWRQQRSEAIHGLGLSLGGSGGRKQDSTQSQSVRLSERTSSVAAMMQEGQLNGEHPIVLSPTSRITPSNSQSTSPSTLGIHHSAYSPSKTAFASPTQQLQSHSSLSSPLSLLKSGPLEKSLEDMSNNGAEHRRTHSTAQELSKDSSYLTESGHLTESGIVNSELDSPANSIRQNTGLSPPTSSHHYRYYNDSLEQQRALGAHDVHGRLPSAKQQPRTIPSPEAAVALASSTTPSPLLAQSSQQTQQHHHEQLHIQGVTMGPNQHLLQSMSFVHQPSRQVQRALNQDHTTQYQYNPPLSSQVQMQPMQSGTLPQNGNIPNHLNHDHYQLYSQQQQQHQYQQYDQQHSKQQQYPMAHHHPMQYEFHESYESDVRVSEPLQGPVRGEYQ